MKNGRITSLCREMVSDQNDKIILLEDKIILVGQHNSVSQFKTRLDLIRLRGPSTSEF